MAGCGKTVTLCVFFFLCCKDACRARDEEASETLVGSESKDGKLEIIKQIKKVNEDGSYTIGYEADDGSFKIESRDVLGNVKGTYGYIDETGEIKRVTYTTNSNKSEVAPNSNAPSVVQRIPRTNRTSSTTRKPSLIFPSLTTQSTPTTTTAPRRRTPTNATSTSTTTESSQIGQFIKAAVEAAKTTTLKIPSIIYATPAPSRQVQFQVKPAAKTTPASQTDVVQKSEGQLVRPEIAPSHPTDVPFYRRLVLRNPLLDSDEGNIKPVSEEPEVRGNILRRQLTQERNFDAHQHIYNLQQSLGDDSTDVYSASVTTGTPRPLFTTTARSKPLSTTFSPIHRPGFRFPVYQRPLVRESPQAANQIAQESATTEATITEAKFNTPNPVPVVQIPANSRQSQEPLVAIRHPFHGGTVLVPVSQLHGRDVHPEQSAQNPARYIVTDQQYLRETSQQQRNPIQDPHNVPIYVRRIPPPLVRSIPVQVDENGFIRQIPQEALTRIQYAIPIPITPPPPTQKTASGEDTEIDHIMPPVSTRDFQKLLEQLIIRQSRLERISEITNPRRSHEPYQQNQVGVYPQAIPVPYFIQNLQADSLQYVPQQRPRQYVAVPQTQATSQQQHSQPVLIRPQSHHQDVYNHEQYGPATYPPQSNQYPTPNKRMARLNSRPPQQQDVDEDYLPPEVREMLLLRMLQLAINPALPLDVPDLETMIATPAPQIKKAVRNVQILGEEEEGSPKRRSKRFWNYGKDSLRR